MNTQTPLLLAGDTGGTKTNLAIFSPDAGLRQPLAEARFTSADYPSLAAIVIEFLAQHDAAAITHASFGVAGPVVEGKAYVTNLSWMIDRAELAQAVDVGRVFLLNDLVAIANAVPILQPDDVRTLNEGTPIAEAAIAVVAPGTGLGEAYLTWDGMHYRAFASEGGHADFAPNTDQQVALLQYLRQKFGRVSNERVCSGLGIPDLYAFLKDNNYAEEPTWLAEAIVAADDPTPVISLAAQDEDNRCELARETMRLFSAILAAEAGNMALKVLAGGGVYLGGGIPPRILPLLEDGSFLQAFRNKGRMEPLLAHTPVHVILNPKAALLGAAAFGLEAM